MFWWRCGRLAVQVGGSLTELTRSDQAGALVTMPSLLAEGERVGTPGSSPPGRRSGSAPNRRGFHAPVRSPRQTSTAARSASVPVSVGQRRSSIVERDCTGNGDRQLA
jgi:hypothetical protein